MIDSWSFSKVSSFSRNEKAFEMRYIYRQSFRRSASEVAGSAYHEALRYYFNELKDGTVTDIVELQKIIFSYIDDILPNKWKLQKTTPTIEECRAKATKAGNSLLNNFYAEISVYLDEIKEVIDVECSCDEFITINGVDIPLPCHAKIDLVIITNYNKVAVIDHKSKASFSDEKELKFVIGKQAATYANIYEAKTGLKVDEVWFIENKVSKNKDRSSQLAPFKVKMDKNTVKLYESLLYEPLKRMLEAISNPDYIYLINDQ